MQPTNDQMDSMEKTKALYYFVYYIAQDIKDLIRKDYSNSLDSRQILDFEMSLIRHDDKPLLLVEISISGEQIKNHEHILVNNTFQLILKHISYIYDRLRAAGLIVSSDELAITSWPTGSIGRFIQLFKDITEEVLSFNLNKNESRSIGSVFNYYFKILYNLRKMQEKEWFIYSEVENLAIDFIEDKIKAAATKAENNVCVTCDGIYEFINSHASSLMRLQNDIDIYVATEMVFGKVKEILSDIERELASYSDFKLSATMDETETEVIAVDINVSHPEFRNWWQRYTAKLSLKNLHNKDKLNTGLDTEQKIDVLVAIRKLITQNESYIALKALEDTSSVDEMFVVYNALSADRCEKNQCPITINLVVPYNINYGSYIMYIKAFAKACGYFDDLSIKNLNQNELLVSFSCELADLLDCFLWEAGYIQRDMIAQDDEPSNENESCEINGIRFEMPDKTLQLLRLANAKPVNNNPN